MKLWLISQRENTGYDTYDGAVVVAETEEEARDIHPSPSYTVCWKKEEDEFGYKYDGVWAQKRESVRVVYIGETDCLPAGVVLASFNAG